MPKTDEELWAEMEAAPAAAPAFKMFATRGDNVIAVGWMDGYLRVAFASKNGARFYRYHGVPESTKDKLIRSPFPDGLFTRIVRNAVDKNTGKPLFKGVAEL